MKKLYLSVDGASKGNPGPAGIGVVVMDAEGTVVFELGEHIGDTTNNVAEYSALIRGLREVLGVGADAVMVRTDSELLARQLLGTYKVKSPHLRPLHAEARTLMGRFRSVQVKHVPREQNKLADKLASSAAKSGGTDDALPVSPP